MQDQPRYEAYERSTLYADGQASRAPVDGTVARGQLREDTRFYTGRTGAANTAESAATTTSGNQASAANATPGTPGATQMTGFVDVIPVEVTSKMLDRGQERFNIYCSMCHGMTGVGDGLVVRRGFREPPSFHIDRLREAPVGHFFDVITNGFGAMPEYASMIPAEDRWAIVAYIRALQLSQRAQVADMPADERNKLETGGQK